MAYGAGEGLEQVKHKSVRQDFVERLENKILSGELKVGEKLPPARELCKLMDVSLTVVNAGVSELVSKGFLEVKPRHGTYVADYRENGTPEALIAVFRNGGNTLSQEDIRSFCESRIALDPFIAELVIKRASDWELSALEDQLDALKAAESTEDICSAALEFFRHMYRISRNTVLALIFNSTVKPQMSMYAMFVEKNGKQILLAVVEETYRLLRARNTRGVKKYLRQAMKMPISGSTSIVH